MACALWENRGRGSDIEVTMDTDMRKVQKLEVLENLRVVNNTLSEYIMQHYSGRGTLNILDAGCGIWWDLDLEGLEYVLTGVDIAPESLAARQSRKRGLLDEAIVGDLRTISLEENKYDIIHNSYVLEHIKGAEAILNNFVKWLKPGGVLVLKMPDGNSAFGFLARVTPFWVHVFYQKYILGRKKVGKPGYGPHPTFYDKVVSRKGIHGYCQKHGLVIRAEYGSGGYFKRSGVLPLFANVVLRTIQIISFGRLTAEHSGLVYIIEKL
jgi:SAM-dependent methyltransferase